MLIRLFLVCYLPFLCLAKIDGEQAKQHSKDGSHTAAATHSKAGEHIDHRKIYTELFKAKRREQIEAMKSIMGIEASKQRVFVEELVRNVKKILEENREILERINHQPEAPFPHDSETLRESLSKVLENIAFFSELSLRFSRTVEKSIKKDRKLNTVVVWAYTYAQKTGLLDADTQSVLHSMTQQLGFVPKEEGFINPFDKTVTKEEIERLALEEQVKRQEAKNRDKKAAKKQKKTGPKIVRNEL